MTNKCCIVHKWMSAEDADKVFESGINRGECPDVVCVVCGVGAYTTPTGFIIRETITKCELTQYLLSMRQTAAGQQEENKMTKIKQIERVRPGYWIWTDTQEEVTEKEWDQIPYDVLMRAYGLESPITIEKHSRS